MAIKTVTATINGQTYTLTLNSSTGKYEATITAPGKTSYNQSGGYYNVTVKATNDAGTTGTADGSHTVTIDVKDHDGNAAAQKSTTYTVDTVPPTLNVTSPADGLVTNKAALTVAGTTNDATSSPVTVTIKLKIERAHV